MLTIGRLAKKVGVSTDCVRFYERVGLLEASGKTSSGYRLYSDECVRRLSFIKHAQRCGFSLPQVRELLHADGASDPTAGLRLAHAKQQEIDETIAALHAMKEALSSYIESCERPGGAPSDRSHAREGTLVSTLTAEVAARQDPRACEELRRRAYG
ncbi:MAG TPA: MerR family transcriptional regulator [Burkholderiales bacterium]|nr:MerR family transcriptional regulator [Burkholderiales bacterium]